MEDEEEWQKERQRHCEEVYTDHDETRKVQGKIIDYLKKEEDRPLHGRRERGRDYDSLGAAGQVNEVRDDQAVAPRENLYHHEVFSGRAS